MLGSQVTLLNFMATPDGLQVLLLSYQGIVLSCLSGGHEGFGPECLQAAIGGSVLEPI